MFVQPDGFNRHTAQPRQLRILVAEDDQFNQEVIQATLERRGHNVHIVGNGREALAALSASSFDLLLLDIRMPEVDGFEVSRTLRARERDSKTSNRLPVIAMTAMARKCDRQRCLEAGVDEHLPKPAKSGQLYAAIDRVLSPRPCAIDSREFRVGAPNTFGGCGSCLSPASAGMTSGN